MTTRGNRRGGVLLRIDGALAFVPAAAVQSIVAMPQITPVPGRHEPLLGIAHVGNAVIPVLGLGGQGSSRGSLVVTKHAGEAVGLAGVEVVSTGHYEIDASAPECVRVEGERVPSIDIGSMYDRVKSAAWG
ncbi:hypothetical protein BH09MYX1_BH09MYX1_46200 [soil metagenome]